MRRQWPQRRAMYFILCWRYLNANIAQIQKNTFFAKKIVKPPSTPSSKLAQTQIMCDLQSRLSKLLKKPYQKLVENCQRQPQFWQSCYKIHVRMEYYWYAKLNLRNMALRYSSVHTKKRFSKKNSNAQITRFRWWVYLTMWSFWCWFDENRFTFYEDMRKRRFFLHFRYIVTLTFDRLTSNLLPSYSCPWWSLNQVWSFYGFPISSKSYARDVRTDGRTDRRTDEFNT